MGDAHPGRRSAIAAAACFVGVAAVAVAWFVLPSDETHIRLAIPGAASMPRAIWRGVSANNTRDGGWRANRLELFEDQGLTALFVLNPPGGDWRQVSSEDVEVIGSPNPADIAHELDRRSPVTVVAQRDITRFTCEVMNDRARGTVEFEAEGLWRGRVEYRAEKRALVWTITEFRLPASRMGVRLDAKGRWRFFSEPGQQPPATPSRREHPPETGVTFGPPGCLPYEGGGTPRAPAGMGVSAGPTRRPRMVRDPVRLLAALVLSAGLLAPGGCVGARGALREPPGYVPAPAGEGAGAAPAFSLAEYRRVHGTIGAEIGACYLRPEEWSAQFKDGSYYGARYSRMLGLNWGLSVTAGGLVAGAEDPGEGELEMYLVRATLELGTYLGTTLCRWYFGGGAGYSFTDERDLSGMGLGSIDDEPTSHVVLGFEFQNETIFATRVEGSHTWLQDSGADHWGATVAISLQF